MTISESAAKLGVSRQRMHQIISEKNLEVILVHPRLKIIEVSTVERLNREKNAELTEPHSA
jgi:hypothetical protein